MNGVFKAYPRARRRRTTSCIRSSPGALRIHITTLLKHLKMGVWMDGHADLWRTSHIMFKPSIWLSQVIPYCTKILQKGIWNYIGSSNVFQRASNILFNQLLFQNNFKESAMGLSCSTIATSQYKLLASFTVLKRKATKILYLVV